MKILFIAPLSPPVTGQALISDYLYDKLKTNNEILIVNISKKELESGNFSLSRFFHFFSVFFKILKWNKKIDIVYLTVSESILGNLKDLIIYFLLGRNIKKTIIHIHGGSFKRDVLDKSALIYKLNMFFLKRMCKIVVLGESHRYMFDLNALSNKIITLPNFVPDNLFASNEVIQRKNNYDDHKIKILYLSNLMHGKGYDILMESFEKIDENLCSDIELHFAGNFEGAEDKKSFEVKISKFKNVFFHGVVQTERKKELLSSSHILVLPTSFLEGQPLCILEAYANACAVIATTPPGIQDVFVNNHNGLAIKVNDSEDLKLKIEFLIKNKSLISKFGSANYNEAKEKYKSAIFFENFRNIIRQSN